MEKQIIGDRNQMMAKVGTEMAANTKIFTQEETDNLHTHMHMAANNAVMSQEDTQYKHCNIQTVVNHKLTAYIPSTNKFVIKKISYEEIQSVILPNEGIGKNFLKEEDEILLYTASLPKCCKEKKIEIGIRCTKNI